MKPSYKYANLIDEFVSGAVNFGLHGCNCFVGFGKGFALELKNKVPGTFEADKTTKNGDKSKLGTYSKYEEDGKVFLNCYTQYHYNKALNNEPMREDGKPVLCDYEAVKSFCKAIRNEFEPTPIAMPLIGCGLAHGDWDVVESILEEELIDHGFDVTIYVIDPKLIPANRTVLD